MIYVDLAGLPPIRAVATPLNSMNDLLFMDNWVYFTPICGVKTCVYFAGNTCFFNFLRSGVHSLFDDTQRLSAELKSSNAEDQQRLAPLGSKFNGQRRVVSLTGYPWY